MIYIEAMETLNETEGKVQKPVLFLAGGITGCPDWQKVMVDHLKDEDIYILNPRRKNFPIDDPNASEAQIRWEYNAMQRADVILFWFAKDTLCPIVLYELGFWVTSDKPIYIGIEKGYQREQDVIIQTTLERDCVHLNYSLKSLAKDVKSYLKEKK